MLPENEKKMMRTFAIMASIFLAFGILIGQQIQFNWNTDEVIRLQSVKTDIVAGYESKLSKLQQEVDSKQCVIDHIDPSGKVSTAVMNDESHQVKIEKMLDEMLIMQAKLLAAHDITHEEEDDYDTGKQTR